MSFANAVVKALDQHVSFGREPVTIFAVDAPSGENPGANAISFKGRVHPTDASLLNPQACPAIHQSQTMVDEFVRRSQRDVIW